MNERYICRGKRKDSGVWIYGDLIIDQYGKYYIHPNTNAFSVNEYNLAKCIQMIEVIPETVGRCTGLKDKNGKRIFEGDVVLASSQKWRCAVVFDNENARFICHTNDKPCRLVYVSMQYKDNTSALEVIGNIHDNPELLEEK